jgi:hypothetical protein
MDTKLCSLRFSSKRQGIKDMIYGKGKILNGKIVITDQKVIDQNTLTSDCWLIQFNGPEACKTCECLNKPRKCGGMKLREKYGVPPPVTRKNKK